MEDEILTELRRIREEHAAEFDYDMDRIFEDWKRRESESGRTYVTLGPRLTDEESATQPETCSH